MDAQPLVSCIMPTANRRAFVPRAVACFLRQDYPARELVVVDDGSDPVADLLPDDLRVRYVRLPRRATIGAKRNLAIEQASGDLIAHWDDDDWHAPHRLTVQIAALLRAGGDLCGLRQMLFHDAAGGETWHYSYPATSRPWLIGGSLLYTRDRWRRGPFLEMDVGEDTRFVWAQRARRLVAVPDFRIYVATIHPANTSPKVCRGPYWTRWDGDLRAVMGEDVEAFGFGQSAEALALGA